MTFGTAASPAANVAKTLERVEGRSVPITEASRRIVIEKKVTTTTLQDGELSAAVVTCGFLDRFRDLLNVPN